MIDLWILNWTRFKHVILYFLFIIIISIIQALTPTFRIVLFGKIVQQIVDQAETAIIFNNTIIFILLLLLEKFLEPVHAIVSQILSAKASCQARLLYFDIFNSTPYEKLLDSQWTEQAELAKSVVDKGHRLLTLSVDVFRTAVTLLGLSTALWTVSKIGSIVMIVTFILILVKQIYLGNSMQHLEKQLTNSKLKEQNFRDILTNLDMTAEKKIFGYKSYIFILWEKYFKKITIEREKFALKSHKTSMILQLSQMLLVSIVYITMILLSKSGVGSLIITFQLVDEVMGKSNSLINEFRLFLDEWLASKHLTRFSKQKKSLDNKDNEISVKVGVELEGVNYCYPSNKTNTLSNISMSLHPGEVVGLVGLNGAGKSTLCNLLAGLLEPSDGEIRIDGIVSKSGQRLGAINIAYFDFGHYPLTLEENIGFQNSITTFSTKLIKDIYDKSANRIMGKGYQNSYEPSSGQWQRIAVARALNRKNAIAILDEPTAAMDPVTELTVMEQVVQNTRQNSTIALIVAHRVNAIMHCDRVYVIDQGSIVQSGPPSQLVNVEGLFREIYGAQINILHNQLLYLDEKNDAV